MSGKMIVIALLIAVVLFVGFMCVSDPSFLKDGPARIGQAFVDGATDVVDMFKNIGAEQRETMAQGDSLTP